MSACVCVCCALVYTHKHTPTHNKTHIVLTIYTYHAEHSYYTYCMESIEPSFSSLITERVFYVDATWMCIGSTTICLYI